MWRISRLLFGSEVFGLHLEELILKETDPALEIETERAENSEDAVKNEIVNTTTDCYKNDDKLSSASKTHDNEDGQTITKPLEDECRVSSQGKRKNAPKSRRRKNKPNGKNTDASRNWTKRSDSLGNVDRELIPANTAEPLMMGAERKVFDLQRWYCISRPQYKASCGISSVVSCWNYLYSTLGRGSHRPITQEEALTILGFEPDYVEKKCGLFTGNASVMRWFHHLNEFYGVKGRAHMCYKPKGSNKTTGITSDEALSTIQKGLHKADTTFIYHGLNHFFCLVGYEETPLAPTKAYSTENPSNYEKESWVLIGDPSKNMPGIQCIRWTEMVTDLTTSHPDYYDIRRLSKGKRTRARIADTCMLIHASQGMSGNEIKLFEVLSEVILT